MYGCSGAILESTYFHTYSQDEKIGMLSYKIVKDKNGKSIQQIDSLPAIWSVLEENQNGYAAVKKDSLWGIVNYKGDLIVPYKYDWIKVQSNPSKKNKYSIVRKNGKYGFLNENGILVVELKYQEAKFYTQSRIAKVWIDNTYWGYIDETGKEFFTRSARLTHPDSKY